MWILSHLFVLALVVLMINLGFWQLRRLDDRKAFNDEVRANASADVVTLPDLAGGDGTAEDRVDELEWRRVSVEGRYRAGADVLVANRALDGQPGYWLVTPLEPDDGSAPVAVVRGFVTRTLVAEGGVDEALAPDDPVAIEGYVQRSRSGGRMATGAGEAGLPEISRVDLGRLEAQWGTELTPFWLQLSQPRPAPGEVLTVVPLPALDDGPHLSYAVQWFIFSTIALIGYPLILRRHGRGSDDEDDDDPYARDAGATRVRSGPR
jgi:surfeit locus 1 family protein